MIDREVRFDRGRIVAVDEGGVPTSWARGAGPRPAKAGVGEHQHRSDAPALVVDEPTPPPDSPGIMGT
jgi:hypothetical protein